MIGHWILLPSARADRMNRCLALMSQDFYDESQGSKVLASLDVHSGSKVSAAAEAKLIERREWSQAIADLAGLSGPPPRFKLERALSEVDAVSERHLLLIR